MFAQNNTATGDPDGAFLLTNTAGTFNVYDGGMGSANALAALIVNGNTINGAGAYSVSAGVGVTRTACDLPSGGIF